MHSCNGEVKMKPFKIEKINPTSERFNETFIFNLDVTTRIRITPDDIEIFCGSNDSKRFTKKELGEDEFNKVCEELRMMQN